MKYLVNRETKEHRKYTGSMADQQLVGTLPDEWEVIEADPEGWIKHDGGECPLPDGVVCQWKAGGNGPFEPIDAGKVNWEHGVNVITHYRPILNDKPVKSTNIRRFENVADTTSAFPPDLIERLIASHKAASELPDIIAELRDTLGPEIMEMLCKETCLSNLDMAYQDAVNTGHSFMQGGKRIDPKDVIKEPEPDMTDWRNWREGDELMCISASVTGFTEGKTYTIRRAGDLSMRVQDDDGDLRFVDCHAYRFRFHSRPTKEQDK